MLLFSHLQIDQPYLPLKDFTAYTSNETAAKVVCKSHCPCCRSRTKSSLFKPSSLWLLFSWHFNLAFSSPCLVFCQRGSLLNQLHGHRQMRVWGGLSTPSQIAKFYSSQRKHCPFPPDVEIKPPEFQSVSTSVNWSKNRHYGTVSWSFFSSGLAVILDVAKVFTIFQTKVTTKTKQLIEKILWFGSGCYCFGHSS